MSSTNTAQRTTAASSPYSTWDVSTASSNVQNYLGSMPLDAGSFRMASLQQLGTAQSGALRDASMTSSTDERETTSRFVTTTDALAQMNESINANVYITNALQKEAARVDKLNESAKTGIYKVRQDFMYYGYMYEYYRFTTAVMIYTMVVTILLLTLIAIWRLGYIPTIALIIASGVILLVYLMSMIIMFKSASYRRKYTWGKYYWKAGTDLRNAVTTSSLNLDNTSSCSSAQ
jgi:hypothetical protein